MVTVDHNGGTNSLQTLKREAAALDNANEMAAEAFKLQEQIVRLRNQFDDMKHDTSVRDKKIHLLQDELKEVEKESVTAGAPEDTGLVRQIRTLENRLDKALIKYNEAQSIRRTYEQILKRLKEERIGFDNQVEAMEQTLKAKQHDLQELMLMSHEANHAKEAAKEELTKMEASLNDERGQREQMLNDRRALIQHKQEMSKRLDARERLRKEIQAEAAGDLSGDGESALKCSVVTTTFHHSRNDQRNDEEQDRISSFEAAFRKIKDATGVNELNDVIQKFLIQGDTQENLQKLKEEAQAKQESLIEEMKMLRLRLDDTKYSTPGQWMSGGRLAVEEFERQLAASNAKCDRSQQKHQRLAKLVVEVKAGVAHLMEKIDLVVPDPSQPPLVVSQENMPRALEICEDRLSDALSELISRGHDTTSRRVFSMKQMKSATASNDPVSVIKLPTASSKTRTGRSGKQIQEEDTASSSASSAEDEEVADRYMMKRLSQMYVEKATKKTRRKKRLVLVTEHAVEGGQGSPVDGEKTARSHTAMSTTVRGSRSAPHRGLDND